LQVDNLGPAGIHAVSIFLWVFVLGLQLFNVHASYSNPLTALLVRVGFAGPYTEPAGLVNSPRQTNVKPDSWIGVRVRATGSGVRLNPQCAVEKNCVRSFDVVGPG